MDSASPVSDDDTTNRRAHSFPALPILITGSVVSFNLRHVSQELGCRRPEPSSMPHCSVGSIWTAPELAPHQMVVEAQSKI